MTRADSQSGLRVAQVGRVIPNPLPQDVRTTERRVKDNAPYLLSGRPLVRRSLGKDGFTLIELMIVIGLIILLVSGLSLALGDPAGNSLSSAQNLVASLAGTARAQAAVTQAEARVVVYAARPPSGDAEKYLRVLQVFRNEPAGSSAWVAVGTPVYLPRGVYLVPPSTAGLLAPGVTWATNPAPLSTLNSGFTLPAAAAPVGTPFNGATLFWLGYNPDGSVNAGTAAQPYAKLVVATATVANNLPAFNNPGAVRGVVIRPSGAVMFVNDAASF